MPPTSCKGCQVARERMVEARKNARAAQKQEEKHSRKTAQR